MNISKIPQKNLAKGIKGRYFHADSNTIGFVEIEKGAVLPKRESIVGIFSKQKAQNSSA